MLYLPLRMIKFESWEFQCLLKYIICHVLLYDLSKVTCNWTLVVLNFEWYLKVYAHVFVVANIHQLTAPECHLSFRPAVGRCTLSQRGRKTPAYLARKAKLYCGVVFLNYHFEI